MGMVFNTTHTHNLTRNVNNAFSGTNFTNDAGDVTLKGNLQNLGPATGKTKLYPHVWQHLNIGDDGVPHRLSFWLGLIDNAPQSGSTVAHWIGQFMLNALNNTTRYTAIEFTPLPGPGPISVDPAQDMPDPAHPGKFIMSITINTDVVDNYPGHPPHGT